MLVDEVVELVLPPFPPVPKLSARTAVPGTRSYGSVAAATPVASKSAMLTRPKTMPPRTRVDLTSPPFLHAHVELSERKSLEDVYGLKKRRLNPQVPTRIGCSSSLT